MASDDSSRHSDQKRMSEQQADEEANDSNSEEVENFMSKVFARLEKLQVISRLTEEPKEQTQSNSESWSKLKKYQKITENVHEFFRNQPSVGKESVQKLQSKTEQSGSKALGSTTGQNAESVEDEEIDIIDLSKQSGSNWNDTVAKQPYIENPEEPSTSTGLRNKVKIDNETLAKISRILPKVNQEGNTEIDKPKLSTLYGIRKMYRVSTASNTTNNAESLLRKSAHSKQTIKETKDEKTSGEGSKIALQNVKVKSSASFKLNEIPRTQSIIYVSSKNRAQQARERLRRKFQEGRRQCTSPGNARGHRPNT